MAANRPLVLMLALTVLPLLSRGQEIECDNTTDPFEACPLDTWVYVLILVALALAIHSLRKASKPLTHP